MNNPESYEKVPLKFWNLLQEWADSGEDIRTFTLKRQNHNRDINGRDETETIGAVEIGEEPEVVLPRKSQISGTAHKTKNSPVYMKEEKPKDSGLSVTITKSDWGVHLAERDDLLNKMAALELSYKAMKSMYESEKQGRRLAEELNDMMAAKASSSEKGNAYDMIKAGIAELEKLGYACRVEIEYVSNINH
jgi:hypothetical protein